MQLSLCLWPPDTLRGALQAYLLVVAEKIAAATQRDYADRADWLCLVLGNSAPLRTVTFARVERVVKDYGPRGHGLMMVTLRKRLRLLRAALAYAADHGHITHAEIPRLPPQLHDDGRRGTGFYTVEEYARFRQHVPEGAYRRFFDLCFWTGHHSFDVRRYQRKWLDPDYLWTGDDGKVWHRGRYWRENHKNRRCLGVWLPMEPEFRELASFWMDTNPQWCESTMVVGRIWVSKVVRQAAADAGLHYVTPNLGMRRSFATMLASREWPPEYIRQALGHEGEAWIEKGKNPVSPVVHTARPTMATSHYLRPSPDMFRRKLAG